MSEKLEYRMYGIVPYNLSPIQQGIQFGHAVQEYNNQAFNLTEDRFHENGDVTWIDSKLNPFRQWARYDKTFMVMNGGTTNNFHGLKSYGTMNQMRDELKEMGVIIAEFHEPDLGEQLTACVFLADERCWDKEKYPDLEDWFITVGFKMLAPENLTIDAFQNLKIEAWTAFIGGEQNVKLREFINKLRFA